MSPTRVVTPECVMDVFVLLSRALADAGDKDPLEHAAELTARVIDRFEDDVERRPATLPLPSPN